MIEFFKSKERKARELREERELEQAFEIYVKRKLFLPKWNGMVFYVGDESLTIKYDDVLIYDACYSWPGGFYGGWKRSGKFQDDVKRLIKIRKQEELDTLTNYEPFDPT